MHRLGPGSTWPELDVLAIAGVFFCVHNLLCPQRPHRLRYSRSVAWRRPGDTLLSVSSLVLQPNPTSELARPSDRQMPQGAMFFASVMGSCSTGSGTAVDSRTCDVIAHAALKLTHGSRVRIYVVVGQRCIVRCWVRLPPVARDVGCVRTGSSVRKS